MMATVIRPCEAKPNCATMVADGAADALACIAREEAELAATRFAASGGAPPAESARQSDDASDWPGSPTNARSGEGNRAAGAAAEPPLPESVAASCRALTRLIVALSADDFAQLCEPLHKILLACGEARVPLGDAEFTKAVSATVRLSSAGSSVHSHASSILSAITGERQM
jgi:hypothetical protein